MTGNCSVMLPEDFCSRRERPLLRRGPKPFESASLPEPRLSLRLVRFQDAKGDICEMARS
jgi:hypothetical protein